MSSTTTTSRPANCAGAQPRARRAGARAAAARAPHDRLRAHIAFGERSQSRARRAPSAITTTSGTRPASAPANSPPSAAIRSSTARAEGSSSRRGLDPSPADTARDRIGSRDARGTGARRDRHAAARLAVRARGAAARAPREERVPPRRLRVPGRAGGRRGPRAGRARRGSLERGRERGAAHGAGRARARLLRGRDPRDLRGVGAPARAPPR